MITVKNVTFSYGRRSAPVLDDFSLSLSEGGVYGLLGPNGAGKSTLLSVIAGALTPQAGTAEYNGVATRRRLPAVMADIFVVPEELDMPAMNLEDFARLYGAMYPNFSADEMRSHLATFEMTGNPRLDRLSMGQRKKVFMSFAMACNTRVLLMDEPTNGLDIPGKSAFRRFVAQNMSDDRIFVISTHQVRDIDRLLDHVVIMDQSHVVFDRSLAEIQRCLKFVDTMDRDVKALYSLPALGGVSAVMRNDDGAETDVNLESLFGFAMQDASLLNSVFSSPLTPQN